MTKTAPATFMDPSWDVFSKEAISDVCKRGQYVPIYPMTAESDNGPIKFSIPGNKEFTNWEQSYIVFTANLIGRKTGKDEAEGAAKLPTIKVSAVNNIAHSLFNKITLLVGGKEITCNYHYAYIAHLNTLLTHDKESLRTWCRLNGFFFDDGDNMESIDSTVDNSPLKARKAFFKNGKAQFIIRPFSPIFRLNKVMIPYIDVDLILDRKDKPSFFIMGEACSATSPWNIQISDPVLYVHKVDPIPEYSVAVERMLHNSHEPLCYSFLDSQVSPVTVPRNSRSFSKNNLFSNKVPNRILIVFVDARAFDGDYSLNPFHYQHCKITNITLYKDGVPFPTPEIKCDFEAGLYARAYYNTMRSLSAPDPLAPNITYDQFAKGTTIFSYDMSPDQNGSSESTHLTNKACIIRLEVIFKDPLAQDMMCLIYHETEMQLTIDPNRVTGVEKFF
jgi:hypothetical protein